MSAYAAAGAINNRFSFTIITSDDAPPLYTFRCNLCGAEGTPIPERARAVAIGEQHMNGS